MTLITQRELRNDNAEIVRRVACGERFTVTRRGVPVAEVIPHDDTFKPPRFVPVDIAFRALSALRVDSVRHTDDRQALDTLLDDDDRDPWVR